jgi:RecG-like helicase
MIYGIKQNGEINIRFVITAMVYFAATFVYACQNKQHHNVMNDKKTSQQPVATDRLLSVANVELTDSGRNVIAWFFETPQIFEFTLETEEALQNFNLLKEAKKKQQMVNVSCKSSSSGKNIITLIIPATRLQLNQYYKEKAQRSGPVRLPPPPNK